MASLRMALGSLFGTVTNTANMVSDTVTAVSGGVSMANTFVNSAQIDQRERQVVHRATFRDRLIKEASMEIANSDKDVMVFIAESQDNKDCYLEAEKSIKEAFLKFDGPVK